MKTPEEIAGEALSRSFDPAGSWRNIIIAAIEADRAQRDGALMDDLRQIRRQEGDWRGVLDSLIGDEEDA